MNIKTNILLFETLRTRDTPTTKEDQSGRGWSFDPKKTTLKTKQTQLPAAAQERSPH